MEQKWSDIFILAGGSGERLWPASTPETPKQFLSLQGGVSFLQSAVLRSLKLDCTNHIYIITTSQLLDGVIENLNMLKADLTASEIQNFHSKIRVIPEPIARHTTAAVLLGNWVSKKFTKVQRQKILLTTSDHIVAPFSAYKKNMDQAMQLVDQGFLACVAIKPEKPLTSYGYLKKGESLDPQGMTFTIQSFQEKPPLEEATKFLTDSAYFWNSGLMAFEPSLLESELMFHNPIFAEAITDAPDDFEFSTYMDRSITCIKVPPEIENLWKKIPCQSIFSTVGEKTFKAAAVKADFEWDDVGSWDTFEKLMGNSSQGVLQVESRNNFVYSDIPVALCGVQDLIVVIKNGKALVLKKGESSLMRETVNQVKERKDFQ